MGTKTSLFHHLSVDPQKYTFANRERGKILSVKIFTSSTTPPSNKMPHTGRCPRAHFSRFSRASVVAWGRNTEVLEVWLQKQRVSVRRGSYQDILQVLHLCRGDKTKKKDYRPFSSCYSLPYVWYVRLCAGVYPVPFFVHFFSMILYLFGARPPCLPNRTRDGARAGAAACKRRCRAFAEDGGRQRSETAPSRV